MAKKIKNKGTKKVKLLDAIKALFVELIVNKSSLMEYKVEMENKTYVFTFALMRVLDENGKEIDFKTAKKATTDIIEQEGKDVQ